MLACHCGFQEQVWHQNHTVVTQDQCWLRMRPNKFLAVRSIEKIRDPAAPSFVLKVTFTAAGFATLLLRQAEDPHFSQSPYISQPWPLWFRFHGELRQQRDFGSTGDNIYKVEVAE